jgi:hypothetical protein
MMVSLTVKRRYQQTKPAGEDTAERREENTTTNHQTGELTEKKGKLACAGRSIKCNGAWRSHWHFRILKIKNKMFQ